MLDAAPPSPMRPTVGIVTHEARDHLLRLLDELHDGPGDDALDVVVVDNASTDGTAAAVAARFPGVTVLSRPNRGFAAGVNAAVAAAGGDVVVVLNSDVVASAAEVSSLAATLSTAPDIAVVAPRLAHPDGRAQHVAFAEPTPWALAVQDSGLGPALRRLAGRARWLPGADALAAVAQGMEVDDGEPDWVLGAAFALRVSAWAEVGGLDEDYFLYFEETDLCRRLRRAGWRVVAAEAPVLTHVGGASTAMRRWQSQRRYFASRARYVRRHHPDDLGRIRVLTAVVAIARGVRDGVRGPDRRAAVAAWAGVLADAVRGWPDQR